MPAIVSKDTVNLISLIVGIILVIIGVSGTVLLIPTSSQAIIAPLVSLAVGSFLAIIGGLRKWKAISK